MMTLRFVHGVLRGAAVLLVTIPLALAQEGGAPGGQQPGGPAGGGGGAGGGNVPGGNVPGGGRPGTQQPGQQFPGEQQQRFPQEMERPIFLQGKVMLDDGTPAPPQTIIERVCNGRPVPEGYTDSKGRFSFQVGQNSNFIADASFGGDDMRGMGTRSGMGGQPNSNQGMGSTGGFGGRANSEQMLMGCELRASLPGYRSSSVELSGRRMFDNPDVGTLLLKRLANVEGFTISATTLKAPKDAKKAFEKGIKEASKQKYDKAQQELETAVSLYPEYAIAWQALGQVYEQTESADKAREAYGKALAADPKFVSPYVRLAQMDARAQDWKAVADTTDRILRLNPYDFPDAYFYSAVANLNLQNFSASEKSAREAIKANAQMKFPQVEHVLGLALAQQNNYVEATEHLKKYLEMVPQANNADVVRKQLSDIEAFVAKNEPAPAQQP